MPDREKVINGLKETMKLLAVTNSMFKYGFPDINSDIYDNSLIAISNALALLKAQEPRVMALEEVLNSEYAFLQNGESEEICVMPYHRDDCFMYFTDRYARAIVLKTEGYGKRWRCWTSRPSDAQMEAEPWL